MHDELSVLTYYISLAAVLSGRRVRLFVGPTEIPDRAVVGHCARSVGEGVKGT